MRRNPCIHRIKILLLLHYNMSGRKVQEINVILMDCVKSLSVIYCVESMEQTGEMKNDNRNLQ